MKIVNRKVVRTDNYRLLNLLKFIEEDSSNPIDIVGKVMVDIEHKKIFVITRPFQVYAGNYRPYYQLVLDMIWNGGYCYSERETVSRNVTQYYFILDDFSSRQIVEFKEPLESIPFLDDLFGISYKVNYNLLNNLYIECVESLSKENKTSKTISTSPTREELMASAYSDLVAQFGNDMRIRGQHSPQGVWVDEPIVEYLDLPTIPTPTDIGRSPEMSAGEISTNPF